MSMVINVNITSVKANFLDDSFKGIPYKNTVDNVTVDSVVSDDEKVIVEIDNEVTEKQIKTVLGKVAEKYEIISGAFDIDENLPIEKKKRLKKYLDNKKYTTIMEVDLKDGIKAKEAKKQLESESIIEDVEYNHKPIKTESYGVDDTYSSEQYYLSKIGAKTAWDTYERFGYKETWVAVIDTGLDVSNKDFGGMYLKNYSVDITNVTNGSYKKIGDIKIKDSVGHGTPVAGIIGAKGNNAFSTVGIGSGPINDCCKLMAIKIANDKGNISTTDEIRGIQYAIEHGAEVINLSIGGDYNSQEEAVINNAYNAGITVVASKGNDGKNMKVYPADYKNVISVSATNEKNKLAGFSNYGDVDIAAPGKNIVSSARGTKNTCVIMDGTSAAAPMVSATAALVRGINSDLSVTQVEKIIYETATNIGSGTYFGAGLVNTGYAVQKAKYLGLRAENISLKSVTETSAGNVSIKWSELYNAEGYCVSRSTSLNGTYSRLAVVDDLSYVDKTAKSGKTYYYKVRGFMYYGHGGGTVKGKNAGYSKYSGTKSLKIK